MYNPKFEKLKEDLRTLAPGVLSQFLSEGHLKSCVFLAPGVGKALIEMGHTVGRYGTFREGHYTISVHIGNGNWVSVDPTFMQFHCQYQVSNLEDGIDGYESESDEEYEYRAVQELDQVFDYFSRIEEDGLNAYLIEPMHYNLPSIRQDLLHWEKTNMPGTDSWVQYFKNNEKRMEKWPQSRFTPHMAQRYHYWKELTERI